MSLSTALMLAPSVLRTGSNLLGIGKSKKSDYEKKLLNMSDVLGQEAFSPVTETTAFKSGQSMLDARDKNVRRGINNQSAAAGSTDESKIGQMDSANENYNQGLNQLLQYAERLKDMNKSRYMNSLGAAEGAKQNRLAKDEQSWANILNPLGQAGQAMAMSELFGGEGDLGKMKGSKNLLQSKALSKIKGGFSSIWGS